MREFQALLVLLLFLVHFAVPSLSFSWKDPRRELPLQASNSTSNSTVSVGVVPGSMWFTLLLNQDCLMFTSNAALAYFSAAGFSPTSLYAVVVSCGSTILKFRCLGTTSYDADLYCMKLFSVASDPSSSLYASLHVLLTSAYCVTDCDGGRSHNNLYGLYGLFGLVPVAILVAIVVYVCCFRKKKPPPAAARGGLDPPASKPPASPTPKSKPPPPPPPPPVSEVIRSWDVPLQVPPPPVPLQPPPHLRRPGYAPASAPYPPPSSPTSIPQRNSSSWVYASPPPPPPPLPPVMAQPLPQGGGFAYAYSGYAAASTTPYPPQYEPPPTTTEFYPIPTS